MPSTPKKKNAVTPNPTAVMQPTLKRKNAVAPIATINAKPSPTSIEAFRRISPFVKTVAGMKGFRVAQSIGDGATDDKIEDKTKFKMPEIRSLLNVLHNHGIVEYNREKNLQTGWFTYTWRVNADRAFKNFISMKKSEYVGLRQKLSSEENTVFYRCSKACRKLAFEAALEAQFKCPKCNNKMNAADTASELEEARKQLGSIENLLMKMGETPPQ